MSVTYVVLTNLQTDFVSYKTNEKGEIKRVENVAVSAMFSTFFNAGKRKLCYT